MLNPEGTLLTSIVSAIQSISGVVTAMGGDASRIFSYRYVYGKETRLELAINKMMAPGIMIAWDATLPGNFNGSEIWKHQYSIYMRLGNQAQATSPVGYADLWHSIVNGAVNGTPRNIREVELLPEVDLMDTPGILHILDEERQDLFAGRFVIPEKGDN